jgi:hypothetical protein
MSTDLDTRLRALTELSPPSHERLGTEELHRRASRRQRRTTALRVIPAAIVVLALLAGAVIVRNQGSTTDVVVGPPDASEDDGSAGLSEGDQRLVDLAKVATGLAHQIDREMLLSSTFVATGGTAGADELAAQRLATDQADASYRDALAGIDVASVSPEVTESVKQSLNRLDRLPTNRRSVDEFQTDPVGVIDPYANTTASIADVTLRLAFSSNSVDAMRGLLTTGYAGVVAAHSDRTAALLTFSVEAGFYGDWYASGPGARTPIKGLCGDDAEGAGNGCPLYADALASLTDRDQAEATFLSFASGQQKQWYRAAFAGSIYDELVASAFEDGIGINDLRGSVPGSTLIDPATWRQAAVDRLDRLAAFQQQVLDSIGEPVPEPTLSPGSGGTALPTTTPAPPATDTTIPAPTTTGP